MGLRRLRPTVWARLRSGWKAGIAAAAVIVCIYAGLAFSQASGVHLAELLAIALPSAVLVGLAAAYIRGRSKLLPDSFVDEIGGETFLAHLCTSAGLREACELTRDSYGNAYVSHDIAEQWRIRNPFAFVQIMNLENRLCACFGVLALRQSFMDQFIAGRVSDQQLLGEDVCGWPESTNSPHLYLSGVVVSEPLSHKGYKRASVMFWAMLEYIRRLYDLKMPRRLYAVAVTRQASQLMRNLGFVLETPAAQRTDSCDLYRYELTEASWNALLGKLNDWSRMCTLDLAPRVQGGSWSTQPAPPPTLAQLPDSKSAIVFVAGDRGGSQRNQVQIPREFTSIQEALRGSENRDALFVAPPILAATRETLVGAYHHRPVILHFAGHGDDRSLSLILDQGVLVGQTPLMAEQLAVILGAFPERVHLCVLNACDSASIAEHLVRAGVVDAAVGWTGKLADETAIAFSRTLYGRLGDGLTLSRSVALASQSFGSPSAPTLYPTEGTARDEIYAAGKN